MYFFKAVFYCRCTNSSTPDYKPVTRFITIVDGHDDLQVHIDRIQNELKQKYKFVHLDFVENISTPPHRKR